MAATNGVVLATEKVLPSILVDRDSHSKICEITDSIVVAYAGMNPDYRVLVRKARKKAASYYHSYHESIPVTQLVREIAAIMQEFTQSGGVRPFGVSMLVAGVDHKGQRTDGGAISSARSAHPRPRPHSHPVTRPILPTRYRHTTNAAQTGPLLYQVDPSGS